MKRGDIFTARMSLIPPDMMIARFKVIRINKTSMTCIPADGEMTNTMGFTYPMMYREIIFEMDGNSRRLDPYYLWRKCHD